MTFLQLCRLCYKQTNDIFTLYIEGTRKSNVVEPIEAGQDKPLTPL